VKTLSILIAIRNEAPEYIAHGVYYSFPSIPNYWCSSWKVS